MDLVIQTAYKQVFGNVGLMESEKLPLAESQLRNGAITVKEFIRQLAKSEKYRSLFWDGCTNIRAIELNFKHLLGRAPESYSEISQHIKIISEGGLAAEIDSYLDSNEYENNFGKTIVPYYRGYTTQTGNNLAGYKYSISSSKFTSNSDTSNPKIASLELLTTNKVKDIPGIYPSIKPVATEDKAPQALPYFGSQDIRPSDLIPPELIENISYKSRYPSNNRRKPLIDKKFLDMARNTPYYLR
ncbi:MAG: phycobilisome rod-core linker polypeptide [Cyanobacteria bacterium P01_C01_bin.72]